MSLLDDQIILEKDSEIVILKNKIKELEKALADTRDELREYKIHAKQDINSRWGTAQYIDDKSIWYDSMRANVCNYN